MKKPKRLSENSKDNLTSTRWKSISYFPKSKMKEEKPWPTSKAQTEKLKTWKIKKENSNKELRAKLKEDNNMKSCSEKSTKKDNKKEDKPWSVNKKPWGNSKPSPGKDKNLKGFSKITNNKNNKIKTTFEEWSTKLLKRKENSQGSLKNSPERATSTSKSSFSWNNKLTRKEENPWLMNKRSKKCSKLSIQAANKHNKKSECSLINLRNKEERVWLTKKEPKTLKELSTKKYTSSTNLQEENLKMKENCNSWETKLRRKEIKVWPMKPP